MPEKGFQNLFPCALIAQRKFDQSQPMGLDLLLILPRALSSGSAVAVVGQRARPQLHCQNGRFFLLI
jgi:hypothetical protein